MRKLKHKDIKKFAQGHTASKKYKIQGFEPRQSVSGFMPLTLLSVASHTDLRVWFLDISEQQNHHDRN